MKLLSAREVKRIDEHLANDIGLSVLELMENAGACVARRVNSMYKGISVCVVCGRGNNGADGLVAARHLLSFGCKTSVFVLATGSQSEGFIKNKDILLKMNANIIQLDTEESWKSLTVSLMVSNCVIDALLGIGVKGSPKGDAKRAIELVQKIKNERKDDLYIVSVDIPSGLDADTGTSFLPRIHPDETVTFIYPKLGLALDPFTDIDFVVVDRIGVPESVTIEGRSYELVDFYLAKSMVPTRNPDGHKGDFGKVMFFSGSKGMLGAAFLCTQAAMRSGTGLIYLASPVDYFEIIRNIITEVISLEVGANEEGRLKNIPEDTLQAAAKCDSVAIGPGLSLDDDVVEAVRLLLNTIDKPIVLDADGINAAACDSSMLKNRKEPLVITPHPKELAGLIKTEVKEIVADPVKHALNTAREYGCVVLLKGARTVVADSNGNVRIVACGNEGMATAGSGDVLTGIRASLLGAGKNAFDAASLGAFVHAYAGRLAANENSKRSMIASDILNSVPEAFKILESEIF